MRKTIIVITCLFAAACSCAQDLSLDDFMTLAAYPSKKADSYIAKKGFRLTNKNFQNDTIIDTWEKFWDVFLGVVTALATAEEVNQFEVFLPIP